MNLDELQSVQSRERQTDSLQQLRESFYADAGEFIQQLRSERDTAAERVDDPFDAPEVNRLSDNISTAEQTVEAIYERRVGKIVKMASLAAADMPAEEEGLTREEQDLFETLVASIENNRDHVLDVLAGEATPDAVSDNGATDDPADQSAETAPPAETPLEEGAEQPADERPSPPTAGSAASGLDTGPDSQPETADATVDAADVMGAGDGDGQSLPPDIPPEEPSMPETDDPLTTDDGQSPASDGGTVPSPPDDDETKTASPDTPATESNDTVDRTTVRITDEVGEIFGVDQREYDLSTDDVVTLPEQNATPLVERDAAEPLD